MKNRMYILTCACFLLCSMFLSGQERYVYSDNVTGVRIASGVDWSMSEPSGDTQVFELVNRNHNLSLSIWKSQRDVPAREYLMDWIREQGMMVVDGPCLTNVDGLLATSISAECAEMRQPFKNLLLAVPRSSGLLVIHFKCPVDCYPEHREQIQTLISSISLGQTAAPRNYYAHKRSS